MRYSRVTCGECQNEAYFVVCEWPPVFYWCRDCHSVFTFEEVDSTDGVTWQLRGFPNYD